MPFLQQKRQTSRSAGFRDQHLHTEERQGWGGGPPWALSMLGGLFLPPQPQDPKATLRLKTQQGPKRLPSTLQALQDKYPRPVPITQGGAHSLRPEASLSQLSALPEGSGGRAGPGRSAACPASFSPPRLHLLLLRLPTSHRSGCGGEMHDGPKGSRARVRLTMYFGDHPPGGDRLTQE